MSAYLSSDEKMLEAYNHGKDLYAMIAASALGVTYEECLEFLPEFCKMEVDGKEVISGSGKEYNKELDENNSITLPYCYLLELENDQDCAVMNLKINDKIKSKNGLLKLINKENSHVEIINNQEVQFIKLFFI